MENNNYIHKTSTGKLFQLMDLEGNPIEYSNCKGVFTRSYIGALEVGQVLRSSSAKMMLKRLK